VSASVLPLSANEFASCGRAVSDSPDGPVFTEKEKTEKTVASTITITYKVKS